jgi:hypothetical protein
MSNYQNLIAALRAQGHRERSPKPDVGPVKVTAAEIIRCYRIACGELPDPPPLDPHSRAAAIVRAYRKACGEVVEEPDEPNRLAAPPFKVTAFELVAKSYDAE